MSRSRFLFALLAAMALAPVGVGAQEPAPALPVGGPGGPGGGPPLGAELLLANTGRLKLTDQQVVRLAAIARRAHQRREAARARTDSVRASAQAAPGVARDRRPLRGAEGGSPEEASAQARAELAEAIGVLTPEQQALAWEIVSGGGRRGTRPDALPPGTRGGPGG